jgi:hypothetical protein
MRSSDGRYQKLQWLRTGAGSWRRWNCKRPIENSNEILTNENLNVQQKKTQVTMNRIEWLITLIDGNPWLVRMLTPCVIWRSCRGDVIGPVLMSSPHRQISCRLMADGGWFPNWRAGTSSSVSVIRWIIIHATSSISCWMPTGIQSGSSSDNSWTRAILLLACCCRRTSVCYLHASRWMIPRS